MARGVGGDEAAGSGGKKPVGHVDRNTLFALRLKSVGKQRQVGLVAGGAVTPTVARERREMIVRHELGIEQKAADQRALAVVDAAAGDEAQQVLVGEGGRRHRRHQKYPSRFLSSMEPFRSWSIVRPWRSDVRAAAISATISGNVAAREPMALVSG